MHQTRKKPQSKGWGFLRYGEIKHRYARYTRIFMHPWYIKPSSDPSRFTFYRDPKASFKKSLYAVNRRIG